MAQNPNARGSYRVGIICNRTKEFEAVATVLDEVHPDLANDEVDRNTYILGRIGEHNVVLVRVPTSWMYWCPANVAMKTMMRAFPIKFALVVGTGGDELSKSQAIRLGDVVVNQSTKAEAGVILSCTERTSKAQADDFRPIRLPNMPPQILLSTMSLSLLESEGSSLNMQTHLAEVAAKLADNLNYSGYDNDWPYPTDHHSEAGGLNQFQGQDIRRNKPLPKGSDGSYDSFLSYKLAKDAEEWELQTMLTGAICSGYTWPRLAIPCPYLEIRGVCDYKDSYRDNHWLAYAAATAATYAKALLLAISVDVIMETQAHVVHQDELDDTVSPDDAVATVRTGVDTSHAATQVSRSSTRRITTNHTYPTNQRAEQLQV